MTNFDYAIETYRNNQLDEYLNREDEQEPNVCCESCDDDAEIKEFMRTAKGEVYNAHLCTYCRKEHIESFGGIKNYREENTIFKIEKIEL